MNARTIAALAAIPAAALYIFWAMHQPAMTVIYVTSAIIGIPVAAAIVALIVMLVRDTIRDREGSRRRPGQFRARLAYWREWGVYLASVARWQAGRAGHGTVRWLARIARSVSRSGRHTAYRALPPPARDPGWGAYPGTQNAAGHLPQPVLSAPLAALPEPQAWLSAPLVADLNELPGEGLVNAERAGMTEKMRAPAIPPPVAPSRLADTGDILHAEPTLPAVPEWRETNGHKPLYYTGTIWRELVAEFGQGPVTA